MSELRGPDPAQDISDRLLDCEFQLEPHFLELIARAGAVGWKPTEIAMALSGLADNFLLGQAENVEIGNLLKRAMRDHRQQ